MTHPTPLSASDLVVEILAQPDDTTCGPTCLHAVYRYHGLELPLPRVIEEVRVLESSGTLAVFLAQHALAHGFDATIYTYNLGVFDPSWFDPPVDDLSACLLAQAREKPDDRKLQVATEAYLEFLRLGGEIRHEPLTPDLVRGYLRRGRPILTGLSATYLYGCAREIGTDRLLYDDIRGVPTGHFVVLAGYDPEEREVLIADPLRDNPLTGSQRYRLPMQRVLGAILLGAFTYDANFLVLEPSQEKASRVRGQPPSGDAPAAKERDA
jgi:hypothetical protein